MIIAPHLWRYTDAGGVRLIPLKLNPKSEAECFDAAVVSRAFENTCAVVFWSAGGPSSEGFAGLSQVALPFLRRIRRFDKSDEDMQIVSIDISVVEEAQVAYCCNAKRKLVDFLREYMGLYTQDEFQVDFQSTWFFLYTE
jgi:predicted amidohydrolase